MISRIVFCLAALGSTGALGASESAGLPADLTFQSGPAQVALIELYTSEGCSSCPPAEKWLGELRSDAGLWKRFVPIAFHVNYWDKLGWRDVLSTPQFTQREYAYADAWHASNVYTPCFARNGVEWRPNEEPRVDTNAKDVGSLVLRWEKAGKGRVSFNPAGKFSDRLQLSVALLGSGIVSRVRAGENSGRELRHEFVALQLETISLNRNADGTFSAEVALKIPPDRKLPAVPRHAVAAWIAKAGQQTPLQAVGGWID